MTDKQAPLNDFFSRHKKKWKDEAFESFKLKISIHNFFKPNKLIQIKKTDDTPSGEKPHAHEKP